MNDSNIFEKIAHLPEQVTMRPAVLNHAIDSLERALPSDIVMPPMPVDAIQTGATVLEAAARTEFPRPASTEVKTEAPAVETTDLERLRAARAATEAATMDTPEIVIGDHDVQKAA